MTQLRNVPTMVITDITNLYFTAAKKWGILVILAPTYNLLRIIRLDLQSMI
jgi:hypothetical protein